MLVRERVSAEESALTDHPRSATSAFLPSRRPAARRLARTPPCSSCFLSPLRAPVRSPVPTPLSTSGIVETTRAALSFGPRCKTWTYFKFAAFYRIRYLSTGCTSKGRRSIFRPFYLVLRRISLIWSRGDKMPAVAISGDTPSFVAVSPDDFRVPRASHPSAQ